MTDNKQPPEDPSKVDYWNLEPSAEDLGVAEDLSTLAEFTGQDNRMNEAVQTARNVARKLRSGELRLVGPKSSVEPELRFDRCFVLPTGECVSPFACDHGPANPRAVKALMALSAEAEPEDAALHSRATAEWFQYGQNPDTYPPEVRWSAEAKGYVLASGESVPDGCWTIRAPDGTVAIAIPAPVAAPHGTEDQTNG